MPTYRTDLYFGLDMSCTFYLILIYLQPLLNGKIISVPGTATTKLSSSTEHLLFKVIVTEITSTGLKLVEYCIPNHSIA